MPKARKPENKGLPARWRFYHGAYFYSVPPGLESRWDGKKQFKLGKTLSEAYRQWSNRLESAGKVKRISELLDRYALEVVPTKAPKTQINNLNYIKKLREVFGERLVDTLEPQHLYQYRDMRRIKVAPTEGAKNKKKTGGLVVAHKEISMLSHAYTKAVEWGIINRHPFKGQLRFGGEKPRERYIEDAEIIEALSLPSKTSTGSVAAIQAYIRLKLLTGMRRGDILRLRFDSQIREDGIYVTTSKTGKPMVYEWSDDLRAAVALAKASRPVDISPWLFCTKYGDGYLNEETGTAPGWESMWHRFMARVMKETDLKELFTDHDIRAKVSSDAGELEHARALLAHADSRITQRVYRRKPERVKPAK